MERIRDRFSPWIRVVLAIQTNATLIDDAWAEVFEEFDVEVGVSVDGPPELNDRYRVDHRGRGSYTRIARGMEALRRRGLNFSILSVVQLGADGMTIYRHFQSLEPHTINFLFPDHNHGDIASVRKEFGPTPVADFMIPIANEWYGSAGVSGEVPLLRNMCRIILGGVSQSDMFGNPPLGFVFIEPDGEIEGLDVLRIDEEGMSSTGMNVLRDEFVDLAIRNRFHGDAILNGLPMPSDCRTCPERETCSGGYLPHRYSRQNGFDNRSAWCADILVLFRHLRQLLGVDEVETKMRREVIAEVVAGLA
jgi:uncharacterized protein